MSSFGSPSPPGRILRERGFPIRPLVSPGIEGVLHVPGLAVPPPVSAGAVMASELARTLGMAGDTIEAQARLNEQRRIRREREDAAAKELDEGLANEHFDRWSPGVLARIANRTSENRIIPAGSDTDIDSQVTEIVEQELQGDFSEAYRSKFRDRAVGFLARELQRSRATIRAESLVQNLGLLSNNFDEPGITPERVSELITRGRGMAPGLSDADFYGATVIPALRRAADRGDEARVAMLAPTVPAEFATERQAAEIQAAGRARTIRNQRFDDARTLIQSDLDRVLIGRGSYGQASERIDALEKAGTIDADAADRLRGDVVQHQATLRASGSRQLDDAAYDAAFRTATETFGQIMDQGASTGGAGALPESIDVPYPSGKEGKAVKRADVVQAVIQDRFSGFDREAAAERDRLMGLGVADADATRQASRESLRRKFDFLQAQGGAKDAVYEPWKSLLEGAVDQAGASNIEGELPPAIEKAVILFEQAEALNAHGFIRSHVTNEDSRAFLRSVAATRRTYRGDPETSGSAISLKQAVSAASRAVAGSVFGPRTDRTVSEAALSAAVADLPSQLGTVGNIEDVEAAMREKADTYKLVNKSSDEVALDRARKDIAQDMSVIDGQAVYTAGRQVPANMDELIGAMKAMYVAKHGKAERFGVGDLTGTLEGRDGIVRLRNDNITVPGSPAMTLDELHAFNAWQGGIAAAKQRRTSAREAVDDRSRAGAVEPVMNPTGGRFRDFQVPLAIVPGRRRQVMTPEERQALDLAVTKASAIPATASPGLAEFMRYWLEASAERARSPYSEVSPATERLINRPAPGFARDLR